MDRVVLFSGSENLNISGIRKYDEVIEDISEHVVLLDVDTLVGFFDVINLPADEEEIRRKVEEALRILEETRVYTLISSEDIPKGYLCEELCSIVGNPKNMAEAIRLAGKAASLDVPVLINRCHLT